MIQAKNEQARRQHFKSYKVIFGYYDKQVGNFTREAKKEKEKKKKDSYQQLKEKVKGKN